MGALQAACELAIQRMTLYEEDAVEANTLFGQSIHQGVVEGPM